MSDKAAPALTDGWTDFETWWDARARRSFAVDELSGRRLPDDLPEWQRPRWRAWTSMLAELRETGMATVTEVKQTYVFLPEPNQYTLYASPPAAEPPPREPTLAMIEAARVEVGKFRLVYYASEVIGLWRSMWDASATEAKGAEMSDRLLYTRAEVKALIAQARRPEVTGVFLSLDDLLAHLDRIPSRAATPSDAKADGHGPSQEGADGSAATPTAEAAQAEQYFRDAPSPPDAPPRAEAAEKSTEPGGSPAVETETYHEPKRSDGTERAAAHPHQPAYPAPGMAAEKAVAPRETPSQVRDGVAAEAAESGARGRDCGCAKETWASCLVPGCPNVSAPASDGDLCARLHDVAGAFTDQSMEARLLREAAATIKRVSLELSDCQGVWRHVRKMQNVAESRAEAAEAKLDAAMGVIAELVAARDACADFLDADDPDNASRIERVQAAWEALRALKESS